MHYVFAHGNKALRGGSEKLRPMPYLVCICFIPGLKISCLVCI